MRLRRRGRLLAGITDLRTVKLATNVDSGLSLVLLVALQALLLEQLMPSAVGGASGPY